MLQILKAFDKRKEANHMLSNRLQQKHETATRKHRQSSFTQLQRHCTYIERTSLNGSRLLKYDFSKLTNSGNSTEIFPL